jgi:hypothetical protein
LKGLSDITILTPLPVEQMITTLPHQPIICNRTRWVTYTEESPNRRNSALIDDEDKVPTRWRNASAWRCYNVKPINTRLDITNVLEPKADIALIRVEGVSYRTSSDCHHPVDGGCLWAINVKCLAGGDNARRHRGDLGPGPTVVPWLV